MGEDEHAVQGPHNLKISDRIDSNEHDLTSHNLGHMFQNPLSNPCSSGVQNLILVRICFDEDQRVSCSERSRLTDVILQFFGKSILRKSSENVRNSQRLNENIYQSRRHEGFQRSILDGELSETLNRIDEVYGVASDMFFFNVDELLIQNIRVDGNSLEWIPGRVVSTSLILSHSKEDQSEISVGAATAQSTQTNGSSRAARAG